MVISNKKIDQAGKRLAGKDSQISSEEADLILQQFRIIHQRPMNLCRQMIEGILKQQGINALLAERVKRNPSIVKKLQIQTNMKLSQMQDIVGLRVILGNMNEVNLIKDEIKKEYKNSKFKFVKEDNYIESPRHSGYRSIHMIYKYDEQIKSQKQCKVEIQIRTEIQHSWATAVEVLGTYLNQSLKQSYGDNKYLEVFKDISILFAASEEEKVDAILESVKDIKPKIEKLKLLDTFQNIHIAFEGVDKNSAEQYLLLKMNFSNQTTEICNRYSKDQFKQANEEYSAMELVIQDKKVEVVLLSIQDIRELKILYPNYFMDTVDFIKNLENVFKFVATTQGLQDIIEQLGDKESETALNKRLLSDFENILKLFKIMSLLKQEYKELERIQEKIILETATFDEMEVFLDLIVKSGNEVEMMGYMKILGIHSMDEVRDRVKKRQRDSGILTGLAIAGGVILWAALFSK